MAARLRQFWRNADAFDRYMSVGAAVGVAVGASVGVANVREQGAEVATAAALGAGACATIFWPAVMAAAAVYLPLKALEAVSRPN